ncbi:MULTISPECIES: ligand-binding sensor domain-containing diguanylate cyclase [unclassified Roseateles]|uniref:ligand-binding sensor domain-containing diguanylate cyclase n=1 Tax=unclassified Roseateles TaxID=2626991 RepID=UPI0006FE5B89|nr:MULTISPECIES: ligand-binding sensor domain-containing diguanylate cyclase [unclassified Roseateles]
MLHRSLTLAICLLTVLPGLALPQPAQSAASALEPQFATIPVPRDVVGSLAQDKQGLIWVGTSDGLARFDGYRLRPIEREGATPVQRNLGWVRSLAPAADGGMWIGTEVNGLARYEPAFDRVRMLGSGEGRTTPIRALAEDGSGQVWVGTLGQGLLRYDTKAGRFGSEALLVDGQPERRVLALAVGPGGTLWAGHWRGLAQRSKAGSWTPLDLPGGAIGISALLEDGTGRLWFGSVDGRIGRIEAGQPRWLAARFKGSVQALAQGADGTVWAGLTDGIAWLHADSGALLRQLRHNPHLPGGLAGNDVNVLLRDQTGAMWLGGYGVGLQRHRLHPALAVRGPDADPGSPLASSDLRGLLARRDGLLMVATHSGPVALLDAQLHTVGRWPREADTPVDSLAEGPDGSVWLVANGRLERREPGSARLLASWALEGGRAHRVLVLPSDEVWVGMQDGLYRLTPAQAGQARRVERVRGADGEPLRGGVHALCVEPAGSRHGRLWVGALAGLFRWDGQRLAEVKHAPGEALGFPAVLGLLHARDGSLYVDTAVSGLHRLKAFDAEGRARFERISERLGAPGRPFGVNLHEDARGRVWSQQSVYDPANDRLDELSGAEGPPMGTPRFFADAALPDGRLLFSGSRGLLVVEPLAFMPSRYAPPVVVSSLRRNGQPYQPEQDLAQGLKLPAGTRSFAVEFAALDYTDPAKLRYSVRLDGWDHEWTPTDASARFASYGGLPPGRYRLEVRATNHHGLWSDRPLGLDIELLPAWWQTRWAEAGALLALAGLAWALLRWGVARRTAQLRRREAALQALVDQRTTELREASTTDPLTGLRNRRYLDSRVKSDLQLSLRHYTEPRHRSPGRHPDEEADLLVMLMDLDHFKRINDRHGHAAGDQVLVEFARRLRLVFRESDVLVRWGGEEFLALARGGARSGAAELAARFCATVGEQPFTLPDGRALPVTVSIGFAVFPLDPEAPRAWDWDATLSLADAALYAAKAQGRDGYVGALRADGLRPDELGPDTDTWMNEPRLQVQRSAAIKAMGELSA